MADGHGFLLQAGDCAESFDAFSADTIRDKLKVILQMAVVLTYGAGRADGEGGPHRRPVRQAPLGAHRDWSDGVELPSFRGDMVNDARASTGRGAGPTPTGCCAPTTSPRPP